MRRTKPSTLRYAGPLTGMKKGDYLKRETFEKFQGKRNKASLRITWLNMVKGYVNNLEDD